MSLDQKILAVLDGARIPLSMDDLLRDLKAEEEEVKERLSYLEEQGEILYTAKRKIALPSFLGYLAGHISANERGFAFLIPEDPDKEDVFLPADALSGAFHNDRVMARIGGKRGYRGKKEGTVVRILSRARETLVGTLECHHRSAFLIPEDKRFPRIFIPKEGIGSGKNGDLVVVKLDKCPKKNGHSQGHVVEVLGRSGSTGASILGIVHSFDLLTLFSAATLRDAQTLPQEVTKSAKRGREDFRSLLTLTVDGSDAKDLDDAISLTMLPQGGWRLYVHIADVSHYVRPDTPIDQDGYDRATSVYFPSMVIPMLPEALSNGICSLNAGLERLALSCVMDFDPEGTVMQYRFTNSLILVDKRCTYEAVNRMLEQGEEVEGYESFRSLLTQMAELSDILAQNRSRRGSIDFDLPESIITMDDEGRTVDVSLAHRGIGNLMIEDFMLSANECAAKMGKDLELPFLYRAHEDPAEEKMAEFFFMLRALGIKTPKTSGSISPKLLQGILEETAETPYATAISRVLLRSMQKARYAARPIGHFGLALRDYCHFTSPIRRYPDLLVHRAIKAALAENGERKRMEGQTERMEEMGRHTSQRERTAMEAERAVDDLLKAQYMEQFIGEIFSGTISSVMDFGLFVSLDNTVEGLIRIANLTDDYYIYEDRMLRLTGRHSGNRYAMGDTITVMVSGVDVERGQVEFLPYYVDKESIPFEKAGRIANGAHKKNRDS